VQLRHLTDDDVPEAVQVFAASLGSTLPKEPDRYARYWDLDSSLGAWGDDGRLLGVAARFPSRFTAVGGADAACTAVPSVGVRPDAHGGGVGRALLERQVAEAVDHGDVLMALNASEVQIYGRYGYGPTSTWWSVQADPRTLAWRTDAPRAAAGSIEEVDAEAAHGLLPELHARCVGRWAGELARHDGYWHGYFRPRQDATPPTFAVHRDADGQVDAAVRFTVEQHFDDVGFANRVELQDAFGVTPAAEALLLRWLLERRLSGRFTAERCNPRTPLKWMLDDSRRLRTTAAEDAVWVRVLDVPAAVSLRTTLGDGAVAVAVGDRLVAGNDRTWRIAAEDGRLTCEPTDDAADLVIGVDLLAPLLWGYTEPARLAAAGRIEVVRPASVGVLQRLVATHEPAWCSTGF
jgi:predicted acetyltransferase